MLEKRGQNSPHNCPVGAGVVIITPSAPQPPFHFTNGILISSKVELFLEKPRFESLVFLNIKSKSTWVRLRASPAGCKYQL